MVELLVDFPHHLAAVICKVLDVGLAQAMKSVYPAEGVLAVEERGLVLAMTALRVAYAGGGDGEMALRTDIRNMAGFVRDPGAAVTAALLPLSAGFKYDSKVINSSTAGLLSTRCQLSLLRLTAA